MSIGAVHCIALGVGQLGEVDAPFDAAFLRPHDGRLARKLVAARRFRFQHQPRDHLPGLARTFGIDAVEAEHGRGIEQVARAVAFFVGRAGPGREVAVTRAVDESTGRARRRGPTWFRSAAP